LIKETLPSGDWHLQEERRLFYVGTTRAKELLYFCWSRDVGGVRVKKISPFVLEALDQPKSKAALVKLSPMEKIEKFAPLPPKISQEVLFDTSILRLTQGSIDDYLTCAYKYRYMHVLGIPILRHHAIAYGAALHAAVAQFLTSKKQGRVMPLTNLLEIFDRVWDSEGFLTIEHEEKRKAQGKVALSRFWEREVASKDMPTFIERKFDLHFDDVLVVGRFDRVDIKSGNDVIVIDYKSSETIDQDRADAQARESIQLRVYALYWWKMTKKLPVSTELHFLETGLVGKYEPTEEDMSEIEKLIVETAAKIRRDVRSGTFTANPKYFGREPACTYCAYNAICPFSLAR
jgi:DNA helicase-2/ATP-dependent DNA helicase PcrA